LAHKKKLYLLEDVDAGAGDDDDDDDQPLTALATRARGAPVPKVAGRVGRGHPAQEVTADNIELLLNKDVTSGLAKVSSLIITIETIEAAFEAAPHNVQNMAKAALDEVVKTKRYLQGKEADGRRIKVKTDNDAKIDFVLQMEEELDGVQMPIAIACSVLNVSAPTSESKPKRKRKRDDA